MEVCARHPRVGEVETSGSLDLDSQSANLTCLADARPLRDPASKRKKLLDSTSGKTPEVILSLCTHMPLHLPTYKTSHTCIDIHTNNLMAYNHSNSVTQEVRQGSAGFFVTTAGVVVFRQHL